MRTEQSGYSTVEMCLALGVSRSGLYDHTQKHQGERRQEDEQLAEQIALIFLESRQTYGSRRIQQMLRRFLERVRRESSHESKICEKNSTKILVQWLRGKR
jgi:putative transposase